MSRRVRIWVVASLLVTLVGLLFVVGLMSGRTRGAYRIVMERWSETLGTPEEILARFPSRQTNEPARYLIESALPLGITLAPREEEDLPRPTRAETKRFRRLMATSGKWFSAQLGKQVGPVDAPPVALLEYLTRSREQLDLIQAILGEEETPEWMSDMRRLYSAPVPNLRGHVDLNKVLIMDGLAALHAGELHRATRALDSAWALQQLAGDDPILIVQLIRQNMIRQQSAAVRHMPWLDHWIPRLDGARYRALYEQALLYEGWTWPQIDFTPRNKKDVLARLQLAVTGPYMTLSSVDASERWRQTILKLNEAEAWCEPALRRADVRLSIPMPWWNRFGAILIPEIESSAFGLARTQLQLELTRRLLELEAARRDTGRWPEPESVESPFCPGDRWNYEIVGDVATLSLERGPDIEHDPRFPESWSFSLDARAISW